MFLIALTGGIASGKSTVARRLIEHGAVLIDADLLAREAVAPDSNALKEITTQFGEDLVDSQGVLDRAKLGALVFGNSENLAKLNKIVHPEVHRLAQLAFKAAAESDPQAIVVYDVPLLVESDNEYKFDLVLVTNAPRNAQLDRLVNQRGLDPLQAAARIDSQADQASREAIADRVIDTGGKLSDTMSQVDALWPEILAKSRMPSNSNHP